MLAQPGMVLVRGFPAFVGISCSRALPSYIRNVTSCFLFRSGEFLFSLVHTFGDSDPKMFGLHSPFQKFIFSLVKHIPIWKMSNLFFFHKLSPIGTKFEIKDFLPIFFGFLVAILAFKLSVLDSSFCLLHLPVSSVCK